MQPWELIAVTSTAMGGLALAGRYGLRAWGAHQLEMLNRETEALRHWWAVIAELPAELLDQPLRCTLGRVMYERLKRARRIRSDHPGLRDQVLRIARFIGRAPRDSGGRLTGASRERAIGALTELHRLLCESAAAKLISRADLLRAESSVSQALTQLEFAHYRQTALLAEALRRTPQAIEFLQSARRTARTFGQDSSQLREVEAKLRRLEAPAPIPPAAPAMAAGVSSAV